MSGVARRRRGSSKSEDAETEKLIPSPASKSYTTLRRDDEDKENNMGRDRTSEFQSALRSMQGRVMRQPNPMNSSNHKVDRNLDQYSEFMRIAKYVLFVIYIFAK
jgi:hypothetical protein